MKKILETLIIVLVICIVGLGGYLMYDNVLKKDKEPINPKEEKKEPVVNKSNEFNYNLILNNHGMAEKEKNYLISPYSIEVALNMLRDGANKDTKDEIDKVIGTRKINDITVKDKVEVANAIFMRNINEKDIRDSYKNNLKNNYNADMIVDEFKTPDKINNWVKDKTKDMIEKILDNIDEKWVLGLANALAIDVEWQREFECDSTRSEEFTKADGTKINVEMMHQDGYQYIKEENVKGIVLPYKKMDGSNVELEFVGLVPTGNLDDYINNSLETDIKNLNKLIKTPIENEKKKQNVYLALPRFTYDYDIEKFKELLQNMGIKKAFVDGVADFSNMADFTNMYNALGEKIEGLYVGEAIHKTHIELMEKGTKAAAVTYFGMFETTAALDEREIENIYITFNKPFIYLIREKNTNEILFFGVTYEPNLWNGSTCNNN